MVPLLDVVDKLNKRERQMLLMESVFGLWQPRWDSRRYGRVTCNFIRDVWATELLMYFSMKEVIRLLGLAYLSNRFEETYFGGCPEYCD